MGREAKSMLGLGGLLTGGRCIFNDFNINKRMDIRSPEKKEGKTGWLAGSDRRAKCIYISIHSFIHSFIHFSFFIFIIIPYIISPYLTLPYLVLCVICHIF